MDWNSLPRYQCGIAYRPAPALRALAFAFALDIVLAAIIYALWRIL
jgi:hypothetical protein